VAATTHNDFETNMYNAANTAAITGMVGIQPEIWLKYIDSMQSKARVEAGYNPKITEDEATSI
jgi:hypothetical protein